MHISSTKDEPLDSVWEKIIKKIKEKIELKISAASSSFYKTDDGLECSIRKSNGELIAVCYRESNKMGGYRWIINMKI